MNHKLHTLLKKFQNVQGSQPYALKRKNPSIILEYKGTMQFDLMDLGYIQMVKGKSNQGLFIEIGMFSSPSNLWHH